MKFLRHLNRKAALRPITEKEKEIAERLRKGRYERQFIEAQGFSEKIGNRRFRYE